MGFNKEKMHTFEKRDKYNHDTRKPNTRLITIYSYNIKGKQ